MIGTRFDKTQSHLATWDKSALIYARGFCLCSFQNTKISLNVLGWAFSQCHEHYQNGSYPSQNLQHEPSHEKAVCLKNQTNTRRLNSYLCSHELVSALQTIWLMSDTFSTRSWEQAFTSTVSQCNRGITNLCLFTKKTL